MRLKSFIAGTAIAVVAVTGCGSSSKSSSGTTTTVVSVCAARADLRTSVAALANPQLLTGGKAGIQTALDAVKTNLNSVASAARASSKPQVDAVKSSVNDLQTAVGNLGNGNATTNLQAVGTAIASVGSTTATLVTALQAGCPST